MGRRKAVTQLVQLASTMKVSSTVCYVSQNKLATSEELVNLAPKPAPFNENIDRVHPVKSRIVHSPASLTILDRLTDLDLLLEPDPIILSSTTASGLLPSPLDLGVGEGTSDVATTALGDDDSDDDNYDDNDGYGDGYAGGDGFGDGYDGGDGFGMEDDYSDNRRSETPHEHPRWYS